MNKSHDPWRDGQPDEVGTTLQELPEIDPPATLVDSVMSAIADRPSAKMTSPKAVFQKRGRTMAKKVLWIVAAAAAAALVVLRLAGYPPVDKGTEATIGAAQRYQAPQIANTDVKTDDAQLQAFLQSDAFRQLAADKAAQRALKNKDFQRAMADSAVRAALASPDVRAAIAAGATSNLVAGAQTNLVNNELLRSALESSAALRAALASPEVAQAIAANAAMAAALAQPNIAMALSQDAAVNAVLGASGASLDAAGVAAGAAPNAAGGAAR